MTRAFPQLPTLAQQYQDCIASSESILRRFEAGLLDDEGCCAHRLRNISEIVPVILEDPSLPSSLLPKDWPCPRAELLSQELQRFLMEPAGRFFDSIYDDP